MTAAARARAWPPRAARPAVAACLLIALSLLLRAPLYTYPLFTAWAGDADRAAHMPARAPTPSPPGHLADRAPRHACVPPPRRSPGAWPRHGEAPRPAFSGRNPSPAPRASPLSAPTVAWSLRSAPAPAGGLLPPAERAAPAARTAATHGLGNITRLRASNLPRGLPTLPLHGQPPPPDGALWARPAALARPLTAAFSTPRGLSHPAGSSLPCNQPAGAPLPPCTPHTRLSVRQSPCAAPPPVASRHPVGTTRPPAHCLPSSAAMASGTRGAGTTAAGAAAAGAAAGGAVV